MYPDLTANDDFHIETGRLWLRWPRASDAQAITDFAGRAQVAMMTAAIPHPYPTGEADRFILQARAANATKAGLVLAVTEKTGPEQAIGLISMTSTEDSGMELGYVLAPAVWGKGFASEAARALVDTVFNLTQTKRIVASSRFGNAASRRVLEKVGFAFVDSGLDFLPARGGLHPCDRFVFDRTRWAAQQQTSGEGRALPPMAQQMADARAELPLVLSASSSGS